MQRSCLRLSRLVGALLEIDERSELKFDGSISTVKRDSRSQYENAVRIALRRNAIVHLWIGGLAILILSSCHTNYGEGSSYLASPSNSSNCLTAVSLFRPRCGKDGYLSLEGLRLSTDVIVGTDCGLVSLRAGSRTLGDGVTP
jgi:hypothetical protein